MLEGGRVFADERDRPTQQTEKEMRNSKEIAAEIRKINAAGRATARFQNEYGGGYDHTADTSELEKEYADAKACEFTTEWSAETTAIRRAAWNKMIKTNPPKSYKEQCSKERDIGFTVDNLKKAVALYTK